MQTFATPAPVSAVLDIPAGRIQLIAADRADTTVDIRPANPAKSRDAEAAEAIAVTYDDGVLRITAPPAKNRLLGPSGAVEVTVQLPAGSRVEGKAAAAELRVVGRLGDLSFDGANGEIKIDEAAGIRLAALDGDVHVGRLTGSADISTQKGAVRVVEAGHGNVELSTQLGDITIGAARGVSAVLDAGTGHGRIDNALTNAEPTPTLTIRATTQYGDITARSL